MVVALASSSYALTFTSGGQRRVLRTFEFALGNASFHVSGPALFVPSTNALPDVAAAGRVVFLPVTTFVVGVDRLALACQAAACSALLLYADRGSQLQTALDYLAWSYWTRQRPFTALPIGVVDDDDESVANLNLLARVGANVTVASGEFGNPVEASVSNGVFRALFLFALALYVVDMPRVVHKFLTFVVDIGGALRRAPILMLLVLVAQLAVSSICLVCYVNFVFYRAQGLPYGVLIFVSFADLSFVTLSRLSYALAMQASSSVGDRSRCPALAALLSLAYRLAMASFIVGSALILLVTGVTQNLPIGFYVFISMFALPNAVLSISMTRSLHRIVRKMIGDRRHDLGISADERRLRVNYARKVVFGLCCGYSLLLGEILFITAQHVSPDIYFAAVAIQRVAVALNQTVRVFAMKPKPSAVDFWCQTRKRAAIVPGTAPTLPT
ncbi:G-protein coupled receptors family 3 profile domain-containing protein [Plasmodiophora brassicae]